jgi:hypothetical protein
MLDPKAYSLDTTTPQDYEPPYQLWAHMSLTELADHFMSDKGTIKHNYTQIYEKYLKDYRVDVYKFAVWEPVALLEIGVACGASLKMWSRYLPQAKITGVDINPLCANLCKDYENINIIIADATRDKIPGNYDIIVDDGSHTASDMLAAANRLWASLNPGGYYIIEDTACTLPERNYDRPSRLNGQEERNLYAMFIDGFLRHLDRGGEVEFVHCHRQCVIVKKSAIEQTR